jgi:hypothetical protein
MSYYCCSVKVSCYCCSVGCGDGAVVRILAIAAAVAGVSVPVSMRLRDVRCRSMQIVLLTLLYYNHCAVCMHTHCCAVQVADLMRRLDAVTATATSSSFDDAAAAVTPEKASRKAAVAEPKHSISDTSSTSLQSSSSSSSAAVDTQLQGAIESKGNG